MDEIKKPVQRNLFEFDDLFDVIEGIKPINQEETKHATASIFNPISSGNTDLSQAGDAVGSRDSEPMGVGVAGSGDGTDRFGGVYGSLGETRATGEGSIVTAGEQSSGETRDITGIRPESVTAGSEPDFIVDADEIGKGGPAKKYRDNVAAIRIIKAMEDEGRVATSDERIQISKYVGWGGIKSVFDPDNKQWAKQHLELKELLTDTEFKAARKSTLDAHYTPPVVVGAMYDGLQRLGFTDGRLLESSVGIGTFFGMMPSRMRSNSQLHGVELDSLTSRLVAALYPKAKIAQGTGFEDYQVPGEYFDAVIGNPPFGSQPLVDAERSPYSGFSIHNYFLAKSIDKLRPGGIMQVVVSHNFLDANDGRARKWIGERASLIGATRLPNTAFKENAGTEVVADVLIFQKHDDSGIQPGDVGKWRDVVDQVNINPKNGEAVTHRVNQLFVENPQFVLGSPSAAGFMHTANEYTVEETGDIREQLAEWVKTLPKDIYNHIDRKADSSIVDMDIPGGIKVGSFYVNAQGSVMQRGDDVMGDKTAIEWTPPNDKAIARMKGMIALRNSLRKQMQLERLSGGSEFEIESNRAELNALYNGFLKQHGHINNQTNRRIFLDDTEASLLQALEFDYDKGISKAVADKEGIDQREPSAIKADIFNQRVAFPPQDFMTVTSAKDALLAALNYRGHVDLDYMTEVYDKSADEIITELGDLVYNDPQAGFVTADEYLSGDVKTKLTLARSAAQSNVEFKRNADALETVIPKDKRPSEISVSIGAAFVPADIYQEFVKHISGSSSTAAYVRSTGQWIMVFTGQADPALNTGKFGTSDLSAQDLVQLTMLGRGAVVRRTTRHSDGSTSTVVLEKETEAAREKQNAIKDEWKRWLWSDPERADKIASLYNDKMNRIVNRKYDGSHLTFPGMNPAISLLEHQKSGVWRGLQSRQVLYDHVVGAGKTFEMATLAMEMRRLGVARKPLFVVPNHLTLQWRSEFTRLYPGSNILAATPEDFSKDNRERLFSKIITGDWDAVIIGHSSLKKIGLPEETERAVLQEQVDEVGDAIEQMKRDRGDRNIIRDMEGIRSRLEAKMKDKLASIGKRSKVVTFDELGIDAMLVDEMHEFKNLSYNSTMDRNPGMGNPNGSAKAFDMFVKTRWLFDTFGDKTPFITATGTPVSNSLVEMYNMQRYMQYPTLKDEGLHVFDAWAKQYGNVENVYEVAPSGSGYRQSTRFAKFTNLPSLMSMYNTFADTVTLDDLKAQEEAQGKRFPVPKLVGGKPVLVVAERSPLVANLMGVPRAETDESGAVKFGADLSSEITITKSADSDKVILKIGDSYSSLLETEQDARLKLVELAVAPVVKVRPDSIVGRFERLGELTRATKGKVNALSLTGEANKAGLDYRLIDPSAQDFAGSKINLAVDNMMKVYHQWADDKGTQLVFCDMSVPLSARNNYSSKDRRLYVRDDAGAIDMKRGTMHTLDGHEDLPYFVVQRGDKDTKRFDVYDAASGVLMVKDSRTKQDARNEANSMLVDTDMRQVWIDRREMVGEIEQGQIDEYNNERDIETDGFEFFTREDIAGMSGSAKFSVYDDIKAKLIAKGVPEREIAFIHDYSTPAAKDKLFKAVNAGEIRFTLGSTPKMGAGTNVQRLLVGLHHIDAPWRPSDLEQREGRIIRRGNYLYNRDPDNFEVFIGRYATEMTYDTRRWQILEHKARGIEQLRNYDGTINEIDDIEGEAANSADMKAASSGDPLILEETKLRNSVRRLEQLQSGHADEVLAMTRKARNAQEYADGYGPRYLDKIKGWIESANANPLDKKGFSPVSINGQVFAEREPAQEAIFVAVERLRTRESGALLTVTYRGLDYTFKRNYEHIAVESLSGDNNIWRDNEAFSASGFIQRMANDLGRLPTALDHTKERIEKSIKDAEAMREQAKQPFMQAGELEAAREAHKKTQRALLVKGPSVPDDQKAAVAQGIAAQKLKLEELGFGDALKEFFSNSDNEHLNAVEEIISQSAEFTPDKAKEAVEEGLVNKFKSFNNQETTRMSGQKKPFHEVVAEKLIAQLKEGTAPWQRKWLPGEAGAVVPMNPTTGKRYRGINAIHLMSQGHIDQRWMTYNQAVASGAQVMKGEKGTQIQYWKFSEEQTKLDEQGKPVMGADGKPVKIEVRLERPRVFFATVFNGDQIDGLPPIQRKEQNWDGIERAERVLQASGARIKHGEQDRAFYRPLTDSIHLPDKGQFRTADNYYSTALHELGHWTGHESRLNRDLVHPFGSEGYAREELRAEIASMVIGDELGVGHDPDQHAAYVGSWIKALEEDPLEIFRAAADAEKIHDYVLDLEQKQVHELAKEQSQGGDQEQIVAELSILHADSIHGYSPLESWENLKTTAEANNLAAVIGRGGDGENDSPFVITYLQGGQLTNVSTELHLDGKAVSSVAGERVAGTGLSSDLEWQSTALNNAVALFRSQAPIQEVGMDLPVKESVKQQYVTRLVQFEVGNVVSGPLVENPHAIGIYENMADGTQNHISDYYLSATFTVNDVVTQLNAGDIALSDAVELLRHHEVTDSEHDAIIANLDKEPVAENRIFIDDPHQLTKAEFNVMAMALSLEHYHPRRWEVVIDTQSFGFSDADTAIDAVEDVHHRVVNNALYSRSSENSNGIVPVRSIPSERVLQDYPDLKEIFADVLKAAEIQEKTWLKVPFKEKEEAKALGAKWDRQESSWYVPVGVNPEPFTKWAKPAVTAETDAPNAAAKSTESQGETQKAAKQQRQYLAVPYDDRVAAKEAGARWDGAAKSWYVGHNADMEKLGCWLPENVPTQQGPAMQPREEFAEVLRDLGFVVSGEHPIMDGKRHRLLVEGENKHNDKLGAGFYVAHLDGKPNGYAKNNKTGGEAKWISKGYNLDPAERAQLQAVAATKLKEREATRLAEQEAVSKALTELLAVAPTAPSTHDYLVGKQATPGDLRLVPANTDALPENTNILIGTDWKESKALREEYPDKLVFTAGDLLVPAQDADGKIWTVQTIQSGGSKCFAKDSKKEGCFYVSGGMEALSNVPAIVIGEGYATADSLTQTLGFPTVCAFDSGNLPHIAKLLHEKFPDKPIVIGGDDDLHQEKSNGRNPGKLKAMEAAEAVGGKVIFPIFAPGEQAGNPKGFTDFNDLATKSSLGQDGMDRQVISIVGDVVKKHRASREKKQVNVKRQGQGMRQGEKV